MLHSERYGCVASYSGEPAGVVATSATAQTLLHIARSEKSGPKAAPLDLSRCWVGSSDTTPSARMAAITGINSQSKNERDLQDCTPPAYHLPGCCVFFQARTTEGQVDEDRFNIAIRKFLKEVGVTSQREIERAVRVAVEKGTLKETSVLKPRMTLRIPEIGFEHVVNGEIGVG